MSRMDSKGPSVMEEIPRSLTGAHEYGFVKQIQGSTEGGMQFA